MQSALQKLHRVRVFVGDAEVAHLAALFKLVKGFRYFFRLH